MTEQEIKQRAEEYANKVNVFAEDESVYFAAKDGYVSGAHSSDEEISILQNYVDVLQSRIDELSKSLASANKDIDIMQRRIDTTTRIKNGIIAKLRNPWISVKERLPEKKDGKIRSDLLLVTLGQYWTAAEYHFGDKKWINMLGERETIEPEYWQEVNLPDDILDKGE